jgi:general secretion pathway protein J
MAGTPSRTPAEGFTLVEMLVALAVFAVIAAVAYGGLRTILTAREQASAEAARLLEVQLAFESLERDIEQAADRSIRNEFGERVGALLGQGHGRSTQLELTRGGWTNPLGLRRSTFQRVLYRLADREIVRAHWNVLDRAQDSRPLERTLLSGIEGLELRFLDGDLNWHTEWPPARPAGGSAASLPAAVEIRVTTVDWGTLRRLFRVPSR